ncbi:MAG: HDOD domain-containing protein [Burkholderiaceae bacterium]|nr:HDOD domain-containing protein [Burkholderiaceae bacterium]
MAESLLGRALIGYEPIVNRDGNALAMRTTVVLHDRSANQAALYRALSALVPGGGSTIAIRCTAPFDDALLQVDPVDALWIEVPASLAATPQGQDLLGALHRHGFGMALSGPPADALPDELLAAFRISVIHVDEDRRVTAAVPHDPALVHRRTIPFAQEGVHTAAAMRACFARGAAAVVGWPMDDILRSGRKAGASPDHVTIIRLMAMIERGDDALAMETLIRRDPVLAYRLLRYINSPGFGLTTEVQSFRHAVMMLGYSRLERWLALLLTTSSKDSAMRPVMIASFRRGLLLEQLIDTGQDEHVRDEVFILGVFSLLDRLLDQPFEQLFETLHVPDRVRETLVERRGPYVPYLRLLEAIEQGPGKALLRAVHACSISLEHCNRAVLRALSAPDLVAV